MWEVSNLSMQLRNKLHVTILPKKISITHIFYMKLPGKGVSHLIHDVVRVEMIRVILGYKSLLVGHVFGPIQEVILRRTILFIFCSCRCIEQNVFESYS